MTAKTKVFLLLSISVLSFCVGRYLAPTPNVKEKEVTKIDTVKDTDKDKKKKTTITETPDGKKITVIDEETTIKTREENSKETLKEISITTKKSIVSINGLVGTDFSKPVIPVYGISVSKEFVGPVSLGVFGLTNRVIGVSLGLNF